MLENPEGTVAALIKGSGGIWDLENSGPILVEPESEVAPDSVMRKRAI